MEVFLDRAAASRAAHLLQLCRSLGSAGAWKIVACLRGQLRDPACELYEASTVVVISGDECELYECPREAVEGLLGG